MAAVASLEPSSTTTPILSPLEIPEIEETEIEKAPSDPAVAMAVCT